jgi:hypothetical protein
MALIAPTPPFRGLARVRWPLGANVKAKSNGNGGFECSSPTRVASSDATVFESMKTSNLPASNLMVTATYETTALGSVKFGEGR